MEKPSARGKLEGERWRQQDSTEFPRGNKEKQPGLKKKLNQNPKKEVQMRQKNLENSKKWV